ncbi:MAG TPA: hypothetical protein VKY56_02660 [Chloroflexota bacterium]|nr:hypothetical protein [Chloroflexota bacterium]
MGWRACVLIALLVVLAACRPAAHTVEPAAGAASTGTARPSPTGNLFLAASLTPSVSAASPTPAPPTSTPMPPSPTPDPPTATPLPPTPTPVPPTATPSVRQAASWFDHTTILGAYGRAFGVAPILGRLGMYANIDAMASDMARFAAQIRAVNGGKRILTEIHLIYALAMPCSAGTDCLSYFEAMDQDLVTGYITPARQRGWLVFLDTQLGRSDPLSQVKRMIARGYLAYDNVEVALDPEFHVVESGQERPGIPIGTITARQVNDVQALLDEYVRTHDLPHKKILIVHQFGDKMVGDGVPFMIQDKEQLRVYPNVDLVIVADGFGSPDSKISKYNKMTDARVYPFIRFRGIKLFPPNPYEQAGHYDRPELTFRQVFGLDPTPGQLRVLDPPDLVIMN